MLNSISTQGYVSITAFLILFGIIVFVSYRAKTINPAGLIFTLLTFALSTYSINCMVVGDCNTLAWVNTGLVSLISLLVLYGISNPTTDDKDKK